MPRMIPISFGGGPDRRYSLPRACGAVGAGRYQIATVWVLGARHSRSVEALQVASTMRPVGARSTAVLVPLVAFFTTEVAKAFVVPIRVASLAADDIGMSHERSGGGSPGRSAGEGGPAASAQ